MIIVDGYNVIHKWKSLAGFMGNMELARTRLIEVLSNYAGYTDDEVMVVFDSKMRDKSITESVSANLQVVFVESGQTADTFIERLVYSHANPSGIIVVTGDRLFRMTVMQKGTSTIIPEEFEEEVERVTTRRQ